MVFLFAPVATLLAHEVAYNTKTEAALAIAAEASLETFAWNKQTQTLHFVKFFF
jgi:hypothetical protein